MLKKLFQRKQIKLNKLNFKKITEELLQTFLDAGKIAKDKNAKGLKVTVKADKSPVTDGDLEVDRILREKIFSQLTFMFLK